MKLDILVFASHPDDAELGCSGTIARHKKQGYKIGIVDLTQGELGTRGSATERAVEAANAAAIMQLDIRENLKLPDGFFSDSKEECLEVVKAIRKYKPDVILCNAPEDRHPDHGRGSNLVSRAAFLSGLVKIETSIDDGNLQEPWRPYHVFHYIQDRSLKPDFVVDITDFWTQKLNAIYAYPSQFYTPLNSISGPDTYVSTPEFIKFIEARALEMGHSIGKKYGEGFIKERQLEIKNLMTAF